ncbi:MAG: hypothetical protein N2559_12325 [Anaerolineae bacterium]|nr:hypothetical protein [Anaerolineae bacterium]
MEKKFRVLRVVASIWKIIAWLVLVLSVLGGCGALATTLMASSQWSRQSSAFGLGILGGALGGVVMAIGAILLGAFYFISLYAVAELIDVVLALEENTRATVELLKQSKT